MKDEHSNLNGTLVKQVPQASQEELKEEEKPHGGGG